MPNTYKYFYFRGWRINSHRGSDYICIIEIFIYSRIQPIFIYCISHYHPVLNSYFIDGKIVKSPKPTGHYLSNYIHPDISYYLIFPTVITGSDFTQSMHDVMVACLSVYKYRPSIVNVEYKPVIKYLNRHVLLRLYMLVGL